MCGDPLRERHEIGDGELFGALCEERVLRSSEIAERNGLQHPDIALEHADGSIEMLRQFTYDDYRSRMS